MSATVIVTALFPHSRPRGAPRQAAGGRLGRLAAIGWALVPLAAMGQVFAQGV